MEETTVMQAQAAPASPPTGGKIFAAIAGVMRDVKPVAKDGTNTQQNFKYRKIDDVYDGLNRALVNNCVVIVPEVLEWTKSEAKTSKGYTLYFVQLKVRYTLFAEDGSHVSAIMMGEGMDSGDKAFNKAMTAAYKYLCFETFCIPIEDLADDPDKESLEFEGQKQQKPTRKTSAAAARGADQSHRPASKAQKPQNQPGQAQQSNQEAPKEDPSQKKITAAMVATLQKEIARLGQTKESFLKYFKADKMEDLTIIQFRNAMKMFWKQDEKQKQEEKQN